MSVSSISSTSSLDLSALRKQMAENLAERMMKDLDKDGDGKVSKSELVSASQAATGTQSAGNSQSVTESSGTSLDDLFTALDSDGDGAISKSELSAFMEKADQASGSSDAAPMGPPPGAPPGPPPGPPPDSASASDGTDSTKATEDSSNNATLSEQQRMAMAYQMLMSALQRMGGTASESSGTSATA